MLPFRLDPALTGDKHRETAEAPPSAEPALAPAAPAWDPIHGLIPPDPPSAAWAANDEDAPASIIENMRHLWALRAGPLAEHAQALLDRAGPWLDYWRANRAAAELNATAGFSDPSVTYEPSRDTSNEPAMAILAIAAAHRALCTGSRDAWMLAIEIADRATGRLGKSRARTAAGQLGNLRSAISQRSADKEKRDKEVMAAAERMRKANVKPHHIPKELAKMEWINARTGRKERLSVTQIRRIRRLGARKDGAE